MSNVLARLERFMIDGPSYTDWRLYALLWPWFLLTLTWFAWDVLAFCGMMIGLPFVWLTKFVIDWWVIRMNPLYRLNRDGSIVRIPFNQEQS
jgi:hypothetical protein